MNYALLTVCCVIVIELFISSGLLQRTRAASRLIVKIAGVITNRQVSEYSRERALPLYAVRLFTSSAGILLLLLAALLPVAATAWLGSRFDPAFSRWLLSTEALAASLVIAVVYTGLRARLVRR